MTDLAGRLITELSGRRAPASPHRSDPRPGDPRPAARRAAQQPRPQPPTGGHAAASTGSTPRAGPSSWCCTTSTWPRSTASELVLLDQGRLAARGRRTDILDPRLILEVFKVRVAVHRQGRRPYLTPVWSRAPEALAAAGQARVHVIAGGGAASGLLEELVAHGFAPTVGIVSVFDTDYATAQRYELEVVSAPPFEPFPPRGSAGARLVDRARRGDRRRPGVLRTGEPRSLCGRPCRRPGAARRSS